MPWQDRLRKGVYTSPSNQSFEFEFFDLSRVSGKKAPTKSLFGTNQNDTPDLGNSVTEIPMPIFFSGQDYDVIADKFWSALEEKGPGTLMHPRWGNLTVLPVSRSQKESFSENTGRASFTVKFKIINTDQLPVLGSSARSDVINNLNKFEDSFPGHFADNISEDTEFSSSQTLNFFTQTNTAIDEFITPLIQGTANLNTEYQRIKNNLDTNLNSLLEDPKTLAQNYVRLLRIPGNGDVTIQNKISGYSAFLANLYDENSILNNNAFSLVNQPNRNRALQQELIAFSALTGLTTGVLNTEYSTDLVEAFPFLTNTDQLDQTTNFVFNKAQVFDLVDNLESDFIKVNDELDKNVVVFQDQNLGSNYEYSSENYEFIADSTYKTIAILINEAFSLRIENNVITDSDQTPFNLVSEFYSDIRLLDFFIQSNNLDNDELYLIPAGRSLKIYV